MTTARKALPANILGDLAASTPAPSYDLAAAMTAAPTVALRYDYAALGAAGEGIRAHAIAIKLTERRMAEATVEAGQHLAAVKATIPHGHWEAWLADELGMSDRTAQVMMQTARRFGNAKAQTFAVLTPSVLGLLASPSVPDAAVDAAIAASAVSPVTVTAAKAIIQAHKSAGRCRICHRTLTDPATAANGIGPCCAARMARGGGNGEPEAGKVEDRPLPAWAQDGNGDGIFVTMHPDAPAPATIAQMVKDTMTANGVNPYAPAPAETPPAPSPAPPRHDSAPATQPDTNDRAQALARLAARLEGWVAEVRELGEGYGKLTGDFTTPLTVRHGLERMQATVQANGENGGWD